MNKLTHTLVFLLLITVFAQAQERLVGLHENVLLGKQQTNELGKARLSTSLPLPFVDDFSKPSSGYPNQAKWQDRSVYPNYSYGANAPSIGVATFDAIDENGKVYRVLGTYSKPADTLTSLPIDLNYPGNKSIYLSFYYQAGGYGDMPEQSDSLILQFYSPTTDEWQSVWSAAANSSDSTITEYNIQTNTTTTQKGAKGSLAENFFYAHIQVKNPIHLVDNFQFRFINYASIAKNQFVPGRASNADHWNLDLVYLNRGRLPNDKVEDVAISGLPMPMSVVYESIPWRHFNNDANSALFPNTPDVTFQFTNIGFDPASVGLNLEISPLTGSGSFFSFSAGQQNIPSKGETKILTTPRPPYDFYSDKPDSADFIVKTYIVTDNSSNPLRQELRQNDTSYYIQKFYDYYAYDDGTAENGYGIFGSGTSSGKVAVRFTSYAEDSIRGVYMYFNKTMDEVNASNKIKLAVWEDIGNGTPGQLIYSQEAVNPTMNDGLNSFVAYRFSKAIPVKAKKSFFVGWIQTTEDFVNVGFDRNRNHKDATFFSLVNDVWNPSVFEGSLMIRPIFCEANAFPPNPVLPPVTPPAETSGVVVSPNPAVDIVNLKWLKPQSATPAKVQIYNMFGKLVMTKQVDNNQLNVSTLSAGTYFMRITNGNEVETRKIIIAK